MSDDVTAALLRALARAIDEPSLATQLRGQVGDWESLAIVLELGEGYRNASGYAYASDGSVSPVACSWRAIGAAVNAFLASHVAAGQPRPVAFLVQLERSTGRCEVTFEETDEERWKTRPSNFQEMRQHLRPRFD
ncbi:hypothetical protein [Aeromicrobium sp. Sec7.5]|uniref:hypothetical protein n=1 Tax=Aeromicrobium sp. Sec7.5 TaxID=3121276 RepID=UPI002FE48051